MKADEFGTLHSSISADEKTILFSCELRLCVLNKASKVISLVSKTVKKGQKHEKTAKNDEKQRFSLFLLKKGTPSGFFVKYGRGFTKTC